MDRSIIQANSPKKVVWLYELDHSRQPFICLAKESLIDRGYSVTILDSANQPWSGELQRSAVDGRARSGSDRTGGRTLTMRLLARVGMWFRNGWLRSVPGARWAEKLFWYFGMAVRAVSERPEVIISTGIQGAAMAWMANGILRSRLVYYPLELYGEQHNQLRWWWKPFERLFIKYGIDALVTQNDERAKIYVREKGARLTPTIVHNYKRWQHIAPTGRLRERLALPENIRIVLYEGMLGHGRWLKNLVLSAEHLPDDVRLVFMGEPSEWWRSNVHPLMAMREIAQKVLVAPWVQHADLLGFVADADVGVIIYDDSARNNYYCEPGKLSDYVIAGLPVIAPNFPTIAPVILRYQIGAVFDNPAPERIAQAMREVLATPKSSWRNAIQAARKDLVWETQYPAFEKAVFGNGDPASLARI
ncbi:MAG: hypothetical protein DME82_04785 [Verrucomicrobia bacterium]|nr:MAG: hypothetical protein DME82_04785 [Verrucomicrobiota bacterium]